MRLEIWQSRLREALFPGDLTEWEQGVRDSAEWLLKRGGVPSQGSLEGYLETASRRKEESEWDLGWWQLLVEVDHLLRISLSRENSG